MDLEAVLLEKDEEIRKLKKKIASLESKLEISKKRQMPLPYWERVRARGTGGKAYAVLKNDNPNIR